MFDESKLTKGQREAFEAVKKGENVFITGPGGVGKSFMLNFIKQWCDETGKRYVVCAPTGLAAVNIGGCTLHKAMGIPIQAPIEKRDNPELSYRSPIQNCDILIIDEISMCRIDLFEYLVKCLVNMNRMRGYTDEPPCKVVLVGDFYQLPPVITGDDELVLQSIYGENLNGGYCINTPAWDALYLRTVELTEVVRQDDAEFVTALNQCRHGDPQGLRWIIDHASKVPIEGSIRLSGRNRDVDRENNLNLNMIEEPPITYFASVDGDVPESMKKVPEELTLKKGARIMLVANLEDDTHVNGSLGHVLEAESEKAKVVFDDGSVLEIAPYKWEIKAPRVAGKKIVVETVGSYTQMPLKLAWAITIHKSQGQTFDAVTLDPSCWECGQLYTALSRLSRVEGLYFTYPCDESYLKAPSFERQVPSIPPYQQEVIDFWYQVGHLALQGYEQAKNWDEGEIGTYNELIRAISEREGK